jgi:hypothetical protein
MMAGGGDGVVTTNRTVRRPSIRPRAISAPRTAPATTAATPARTRTGSLPPVRLPARRVVASAPRPVLALLDADESHDSLVVQASHVSHAPHAGAIATTPRWRQPRSLAAMAASVVIASATFLGLWSMRAPAASAHDAQRAHGQSLTTTAATVALGARDARDARGARAQNDAPFVPVVDVKSLPSVRRPRALPHARAAAPTTATTSSHESVAAEVLEHEAPAAPAAPAAIAERDDTR